MFQDRVCGVPALDSDGYGKLPLGDRAIPNLMAALTRPVVMAPVLLKGILEGAIEVRHLGGAGLPINVDFHALPRRYKAVDLSHLPADL